MSRPRQLAFDRIIPAAAIIAAAAALTCVGAASAALGKVTAGTDMRTGGISGQGGNSSGYNSQQGPSHAPLFFNECVISDLNEACLTSDSKWLSLQPNLETTGFKIASSLSVSKPLVDGFVTSQENITISLVVSDLASFEVAAFRFFGSMTGFTADTTISLTGPGVNLHYGAASPVWDTCFQVVDGEYILSINSKVELSGPGTGSKALDYSLTLETEFCPQAPMSGAIIDPTSGHRYALLSPGTWEETHNLALGLGGELATIGDEPENEWILGHLANNVPGLAGLDLWIGINDVAREGAFVWSSGQPTAFFHWAPGEPDDAGEGGAGADFAQMSGTSGLWSDMAAMSQRFGVVEFELPSCGPGAGTCFAAHRGPGCDGESCCHTVCDNDIICCEIAWDGDCVEQARRLCDPGVVAGPVFNPATGHHYYLLEPGAWSEAQKAAFAINGSLAIIDDAAENEWARLNVAMFDGTARSCFIGLNDQAVSGVFQWPDHGAAGYTNWAAGEPSNSTGDDHFARLDGDTGAWSVHDNTGGAGFTTFAIVEVACIGDVDADGDIDSADIGVLLAAWNTSSAASDLDQDGVVDGADLGLLLGSWGSGCDGGG